jgi:hypothetical protein
MKNRRLVRDKLCLFVMWFISHYSFLVDQTNSKRRDSDTENDEIENRGPTDAESILSNKGSISLSSYAEEELEEPHVLDEMEISEPLFVHLTCSMRMGGKDFRSIDISTLPTCFCKCD